MLHAGADITLACVVFFPPSLNAIMRFIIVMLSVMAADVASCVVLFPAFAAVGLVLGGAITFPRTNCCLLTDTASVVIFLNLSTVVDRSAYITNGYSPLSELLHAPCNSCISSAVRGSAEGSSHRGGSGGSRRLRNATL